MNKCTFLCFSYLFSILILFLPLRIYASEQSTIIDTIWTENSLQGGIGYHVQNGTYYGGILPPSDGTFHVGDSYDEYSDFNDIVLRAYFSFPIQQTPMNYFIENVVCKLYLADYVGNDLPGFPIWYNHQTYPCDLYHIDYGLTFEPDDFDPTIYDTLGSINSNAVLGWQNLDITEAYLHDIQEMRPYCQLMLKFPILTDYDQMADLLMIGSSYAVYHPLRVIITFIDPTINNDEAAPLSDVFHVYPNPFKDYTTLDFELPGKEPTNLDVYNTKGQKVIALADGFRPKGLNTVCWNGKDSNGRQVVNGIYFCRLVTPTRVQTRKLILLK